MDTMRIVTRCTSLEQFITIFRRFVHESSCFIPSLDTRAPGTETAFSIRLADGTPVLRGLCEVIENWKTADNPFKRPGVYIGIKRLTADSAPIFRELQIKPEEGERRRRPKDTIQEDAAADDAAPTAKGTLPQPRLASEGEPAAETEPRPERAKATTDGDALVPHDVSGDLKNVPMSAVITSGSETSRIQVTATTNRAAEPLATIKMPRMSVPDIKPIVPIAKPAPKLPPISVPAKPEPKVHAKPEAKVEAPSEPAPATEPKLETEAKLEAKPDVEAPPETEAKVEASPEPKLETEAKPEAKIEAKPEAKDEAKPDVEAKPEAEAKPERKPPSKLDAMVALVKGPKKLSPTPTVETPPLQMQYEVETRAPGSGWVLPANPLTSLSDDKLEAFIDCTLYEETEDTGLAEVLSLPKEGALGMGAAPAREDKAPQDAVPEKSLTSQLASASQPAKGREQIATLLGVAPLVAPKAEPPVVVPSQVPKPFRTTAPKMAVAAEPTATPVEAAREPSRSALKPALIAAGVAVAITIVILLASSSGKSDKPAPPPSPPPPTTTSGAVTPVEPPQPPPAAPAVEDEAIEMEPATPPVAPAPKTADKQSETPACKLVVNTTPAGAWVRVDSDYKGKSPVTVDGPCKRRKIEVAANGFETQTKRIVMTSDETLELALVPKKPTAKPATAKTKPATKPTKPKSTIDI